MKGLITYLNKYYDIQDKIILCYRPDLKSYWGDRCLYLSKDYMPSKNYNHRSILKNEVVIEYDETDKDLNRKLANDVCIKLRNNNIKYAKWTSGNKSVHVHVLLDIGEAKNIPLLKRTFMKYFGGNKLPDMRLAAANHLIRAEYGVHEKTGKKKVLLYKDKDYPCISEIPQEVWDKYYKAQRDSVNIRMGLNLKDFIALPGFKYIVTSTEFRAADDGRERALFMLIHILKEQYKDKKEEFIHFLQEWYRYSGGHQLDDESIRRKVIYHWKRTYNIGERYLNELLESIGKEDLIRRK